MYPVWENIRVELAAGTFMLNWPSAPVTTEVLLFLTATVTPTRGSWLLPLTVPVMVEDWEKPDKLLKDSSVQGIITYSNRWRILFISNRFVGYAHNLTTKNELKKHLYDYLILGMFPFFWECSHFLYLYQTSTSRWLRMKKHQVSIIDIAKELGISKSTVSRALSGHPSVMEKTRIAVLELAEKLDYQRNTLALSFANQKTLVIGIIVPEIISSFYSSVIIGAEEVLLKEKYRCYNLSLYRKL
jgi:transcriptional regulator with XRE-family HTH domain